MITAQDGEQGHVLARSESPDLILMDISLPAMDGWELTRRLKAGGGSGQRLFPGRGAKAPAVSDQRLGQTAKATIHEPNTIGKRPQR